MSGNFIVFEGLDGCGKTTQINMLKELPECKDWVFTSPFDTPLGAKIKAMVLGGEAKAKETQALMMLGACSDAWFQIIQPALKKGETVVSDRWVGSSYAYQNIPFQILDFLGKYGAYNGLLLPCLISVADTILLECDPLDSLRRTEGREERPALDIYEQSHISEYITRFKRYNRLAERDYWTLVKQAPIGTTHIQILKILNEKGLMK